MDITQLAPFLTGSGGAVIAMLFWVKTLLTRIDQLEQERQRDKERIFEMQQKTVRAVLVATSKDLEKREDLMPDTRSHRPTDPDGSG